MIFTQKFLPEHRIAVTFNIVGDYCCRLSEYSLHFHSSDPF